MQLIKKIGSKQVLGNVTKWVQDNLKGEGPEFVDGMTKDAFTVYGIAKGVKTGVSTYGEWTAFQGTFEGVNLITGEAYAAVQCFVPEPLQSMLIEAMKKASTIEFAFKVGVKRRDDLERGYEYVVTPLTETQEANPLAHLKALALPASIEVTKDEPAPKGKAKA